MPKRVKTPEQKAAWAAYMREYSQRPENREAILNSARKKRAKKEYKAAQKKRESEWRSNNPRTPEDLAKEALREREKRKASAKAQGREVGTWVPRGIDWSDRAQVNEYYRKQAAKYNQREEVLERRRKASREYASRPEIVASRQAKLRAQAEAEGRQFLPWGRSPEQKVADLRARWSDGALTVEKQGVARNAVRIMLAHGHRKGLCQLRHRSVCTGQIEGHHWKGYEAENWTDVLWLCKRHHEAAESKEVTDASPYEPDLSYACQVNSVWANYVTPFEKICIKCHIAKPLTEFYKASLTTDRLTSRCKACCTQATLESRAKRSG